MLAPDGLQAPRIGAGRGPYARGSTCCCWSGREPGFWQSVTGSREPDDPDLEATARRELLEETGLSIGTLTDWRLTNRYEIWPQWRARYAPDVTHNVEHVFGFQVPELTVATLDPAEHVAQLWLPWQEAMAKVFSPTNRDAIWQLPRRRDSVDM